MSKLRILVVPNNSPTPIFVFERAIDKARPAGNFATGLVSIGGTRYRISLDTDKQIYPSHPVEGLYEACVKLAYQAYVKACHAESVEAHDRQMWEIHGYPLDSIGSKLNWSLERVA